MLGVVSMTWPRTKLSSSVGAEVGIERDRAAEAERLRHRRVDADDGRGRPGCVPSRRDTAPRSASDGMAQSWKPSCSASLA